MVRDRFRVFEKDYRLTKLEKAGRIAGAAGQTFFEFAQRNLRRILGFGSLTLLKKNYVCDVVAGCAGSTGVEFM